MGPVFVVGVAIAVFSFALAQLLAMLGGRYDHLTGHTATVHRQAPWLRSMRGERPVYPGEHAQVSALERVLVIMAVSALGAFEVWFFFFSGSPI
jgi:hypothetical protein